MWQQLEQQLAEKDRQLQHVHGEVPRVVRGVRVGTRPHAARRDEGRGAKPPRHAGGVSRGGRQSRSRAGRGAEHSQPRGAADRRRHGACAVSLDAGELRRDADCGPRRAVRPDPPRSRRDRARPTIPASDGVVVGIIKHGYAVGEQLLRPATVAVARLTGNTYGSPVRDDPSRRRVGDGRRGAARRATGTLAHSPPGAGVSGPAVHRPRAERPTASGAAPLPATRASGARGGLP